MVHAMTRSGSDHTFLIIDSGKHAHLGNKAIFSFELSWLRKEGFYDLITREWNSVTTGSSPIERWQNKIRHLRQYLRGWAKNISGKYKKMKQKLILLIDELDIKAETSTLTAAECAVKKRPMNVWPSLDEMKSLNGCNVQKLSMCKKGVTIPNIFI